MSLKHIVEGWRNHIIPPKDMKAVIEKVSEERLEICKACPYQSDNVKESGRTIYRPDLHCTSCGCTLVAKTKSLSSRCPIGKWEAMITDEERFELEKQIKEHNDELQTGDTERVEDNSEDIS